MEEKMLAAFRKLPQDRKETLLKMTTRAVYHIDLLNKLREKDELQPAIEWD